MRAPTSDPARISRTGTESFRRTSPSTALIGTGPHVLESRAIGLSARRKISSGPTRNSRLSGRPDSPGRIPGLGGYPSGMSADRTTTVSPGR